jgi:excisionase family DNA binding protein
MSTQSQPIPLSSLRNPDWEKRATADRRKLLEPLLDVKGAASLLGISVKTLRDWIQERKIDYVKAGKRVMIQPDTIREFISRNTRHAKSR